MQSRAGRCAAWACARNAACALTAGPNAWPVTAATFILVHKKQANAASGRDVLSFFDWAYKNGDAAAQQLDYLPMPASVKDLVRKSWSKVVGPDGKPVYR